MMDCTKLRSDIARLEMQRADLKQWLDNVDDKMHGKDEVFEAWNRLDDTENQILESYLPDFKEQYPELTKWTVRNEIRGFELDRKEAGISAIEVLPDGNTIIGTEDGILFKCQRDDNGELRIIERINLLDGFSFSCHNATLSALIPLSEDSLMAFGGYGEIVLCRMNEDGEWFVEETIEGFKDSISCAAILPDGGFVVVGDNGEFRECRFNDMYGKWELGDEIKGLEEALKRGDWPNTVTALGNNEVMVGTSNGKVAVFQKTVNGKWGVGQMITLTTKNTSVYSIVQLSDNNVMIGGEYSTVCTYKKNETGEWEPEDTIEGFAENTNFHYSDILYIAKLPNTDMVMVGGDSGILRPCLMSHDGKWKFGEMVTNCLGGATISHMAQTPEGNLIIGSYRGTLCEVASSFSIDTIKRHLDAIIERGE